MTTLRYSDYSTPVGTLRCATRDTVAAVIVGMAWVSHWDAILERLVKRFGDVEPVDGQPIPEMVRYLAGECKAIDTLIADTGGTDFQHSVWTELRKIPPGETISYSELAARIGRPGASRAAGTANGANPIWVIVPCHRVVGADGDLTGYAGGLERKAWLLAHEGAVPARRTSLH